MGDIPLLPSNVIDFVMLSAQMVLMFSRLPGEAYFPRVTGMSRRLNARKLMQRFDSGDLLPFFLMNCSS